MDADLIIAAPEEVRLELRCEGGMYLGVVINERWLEIPCTDKRCKRSGFTTVNVWDLVTGWKKTVYREIQHKNGNGAG